ncbi:hypothetical protein ACFX1T_019712 [Malus domestica]
MSVLFHFFTFTANLQNPRDNQNSLCHQRAWPLLQPRHPSRLPSPTSFREIRTRIFREIRTFSFTGEVITFHAEAKK